MQKERFLYTLHSNDTEKFKQSTSWSLQKLHSDNQAVVDCCWRIDSETSEISCSHVFSAGTVSQSALNRKCGIHLKNWTRFLQIICFHQKWNNSDFYGKKDFPTPRLRKGTFEDCNLTSVWLFILRVKNSSFWEFTPEIRRFRRHYTVLWVLSLNAAPICLCVFQQNCRDQKHKVQKASRRILKELTMFLWTCCIFLQWVKTKETLPHALLLRHLISELDDRGGVGLTFGIWVEWKHIARRGRRSQRFGRGEWCLFSSCRWIFMTIHKVNILDK